MIAPAAVRFGHRSVFQPSEPAFWVFGAFIAYGIVRVAAALLDLAGIASSAWALAGLLVVVYALPAFVLVYELDLYEREPVSMMLGAFAWGAFAATALSLDASAWTEVFTTVVGADAGARWSPVVVAPVLEEVLKGAGLVLLAAIARDEIDDVMDGFVYGAVCGLGFAVVEDVVYFVATFGGSVGAIAEGFAARVLASGLYGHVLYTGLIGMALGFVVSRREGVPTRRRVPIAIALCVLGIAGHALWNSPFLASLYPAAPVEGVEWVAVATAAVVRAAPLALVVVVAVALAHRRERRWLANALTVAARGDALTPEDAAVLAVPGGRRRAVRAMRRRAGPTAARLLARLHREEITLAMLVSHAGGDARPLGGRAVEGRAVQAQRSRCRSLRLALDAIPGAGTAVAHDLASSDRPGAGAWDPSRPGRPAGHGR
ncbi:MAG TPA: PrsW family intramembrane metalloprotease [Actinomycetota bacterium]|nr:PrsW family intramembrane metalloprotease [Actinomycetota bacterium]